MDVEWLCVGFNHFQAEKRTVNVENNDFFLKITWVARRFSKQSNNRQIFNSEKQYQASYFF